MSLTTVRSPFVLSDYTPLSEHEEQTPDSFFDGKPVLHYHATGVKAWVAKSRLGKLPFFPADLTTEPTAPENSTLGPTEANAEQKVDLFVNSRNLSIFCPAAECGVSIPYQQISLHAVKLLRANGSDQVYPSVYLQIELADGGADDDDFDTLELTLIPSPASQQSPAAAGTATATTTTTTTTGAPGADAGSAEPKSEAAKLFEAITECSNLNPDAVQDGDGDDEDEGGAGIIFEGDYEAVEGFGGGVFAGARDGGLPPAMPGSSGWITAENVHEYFDEEGNWIGDDEGGGGVSGELGDGAGTVHGRGEDDGVNGDGSLQESESKRPRVE